MRTSPRYPFSDLTPDEVRALTASARQERARAARALFAMLLALPGTFRLPARQREAQVWPPQGVPALNPEAYR